MRELREEQEQDEKIPNLQTNIEFATISISRFIADHLPNSCRHVFTQSDIVQGKYMEITKRTELAKKLGGNITDDLDSRLRKNCFPFIIDESTNCLTVIIKYYDEKQKTRTLDLTDLYVIHKK